MSLKYTCPNCGTPLGYEGLCWKCRCEQDRQAVLAWMLEQIVGKQKLSAMDSSKTGTGTPGSGIICRIF